MLKKRKSRTPKQRTSFHACKTTTYFLPSLMSLDDLVLISAGAGGGEVNLTCLSKESLLIRACEKQIEIHFNDVFIYITFISAEQKRASVHVIFL